MMIEEITVQMAERLTDPLSLALVALGLVVVLLISPFGGAAREPAR